MTPGQYRKKRTVFNSNRSETVYVTDKSYRIVPLYLTWLSNIWQDQTLQNRRLFTNHCSLNQVTLLHIPYIDIWFLVFMLYECLPLHFVQKSQ